MYIKILVVILSVFILSPVNAADINYDAIVVLKDIGTSTPDGDNENPRTVDDAIRRNARLLEIAYHEKLLTANGTVTTADTYIIGSSSASILVSFPAASACADGTTTKQFVIKNRGAGTMTLSPTVDGVGSPTVSQNGGMTIFTNGTVWFEERVKNAEVAGSATTATNAILLNNQLGSYYTNASNLNAGEVPLAQIPSTLTGKDADTLDGQHGSYYRDAANLNANTVPLAQIPTTLTGKDADTLDTINSTGFVWVNTTYLKSWQAGAVIGTGTMNLVAGAGIAITGTVTDGVGTVTITGVGTTTAGGFLDTGTQSVLTSGYQLNLNSGNIVGIADSHIPNTITLDNITQITTRNFSDLQGTVNLNTQTSSTIGLGTQTSGTISLGTQTSGLLSLGTQTYGVLPVNIVSATKTDPFTTTSESYTDVSDLSVSMTLGSTTSSVLIIASVSGNAWTNRGMLQLARGTSTALSLGDTAGSRSVATVALVDTGDNAGCPVSTITYVDTNPGTLTPTYKIQAKVNTTATLYINRSVLDTDTNGYVRTSSTITAMEFN